MSEVKTRKRAKQTAVRPESIVNNEPRLLESFEIGDASHQGDLTIVRIGSLPASAKPRKERQLAEGNTQGSRHVLARGEVFDASPTEVRDMIGVATKCDVDARYVGPVFVSPSDPTPHDLTHPEHGHQGFPAGAVCAVVFQRNLDGEEREQRTQD
jgi:hypothetical protein